MSTPTVNTPTLVFPAKLRPGRKLITQKRFLLPVTAMTFLIIGGIMGGTSAPAPVTVAGPATVTTVTTAPAECGTALDFAAQFMTAIGTEHAAMGAAFTKAGKDGDINAMASTLTAAVTAANDTTTTITTPMTAAATVCRAAIK